MLTICTGSADRTLNSCQVPAGMTTIFLLGYIPNLAYYFTVANTVTIGVTNNWGASPAAYETADQCGAETALQLMGREITHKTRLFNFPGSGPDSETVMLTLLMSPSVAKSLAAAGYSKRDVIQHVFDRARMPLGDFDWVLKYTAIMRTTARERAEAGEIGRAHV